LNILTCEKDTTGLGKDCSPYSGITEVDHLGNAGTIDFDDWKESGIINSPLAFPNPTNGLCNIKFGLISDAFVSITINDRPNQVVKTLINRDLLAGIHWIQFDLTTNTGQELQNCIYRIYISATNDKGITYKTYGDLKVEK
jgi:hypothetical protein